MDGARVFITETNGSIYIYNYDLMLYNHGSSYVRFHMRLYYTITQNSEQVSNSSYILSENGRKRVFHLPPRSATFFYNVCNYSNIIEIHDSLSNGEIVIVDLQGNEHIPDRLIRSQQSLGRR